MNINEIEVKKIIKLTGLSFSEEDLKLYQKDLTNIINFFDQLKKLNTDGVEPLYNINTDNLRLRKDEVIKRNTKDDIIKNVPKDKYGFFVVPKTVE